MSWIHNGCSIAEYNTNLNSKMDIRKWKIIKNTIQVSLLILHSIIVSYIIAQQGQSPLYVGVLTLIVIGSLVGIEWVEMPSIEVVKKIKENGGD